MSSSKALKGVRSKLDRAQQHFADIHARIKATLRPEIDGQDIIPTHELDTERQHLTVKLPKSKPLDPFLPLIVGDCLHNLRSALDHLVFQLAVLNGTGTAAASNISFPVCLTTGDFKNSVRRRVSPFVSADALTAIEDRQPYKTTNEPDTDLLWQLSQLDIIDKHRLLVVVLQKFKPVSFELTVPTGNKFSHTIPHSEWKPTEDGAEILRFDLSRAIARPGEVNVKIKTATTVQFANTGLFCDGRIVEEIIDGCGKSVENIIDDFGKRFFKE